LAVKYCGKAHDQLRREKNRLFFNEFILLIIEGYMELAISGFINFYGSKNSEATETGEIVST
jgi:hypothetical protein